MGLEDVKKIIFEKLEQHQKHLIMGVGASFRQDDIVGTLLLKNLITMVREHLELHGIPYLRYEEDELLIWDHYFLLNASVVPERYLDEIVEFHPDHVFIIDAAELSQRIPGEVAIIPKKNKYESRFSTHVIPLQQFDEILMVYDISIDLTVIGVQPKVIQYGEELSAEVNDAMEFLKSNFYNIIVQNDRI